MVDEDLLEELRSLGQELRGVRVAHINATANGGGVSEILRSVVPMYRGLGVDASWLVLQGDEPFFKTTKKMHNGLQGAPVRVSAKEWDAYLAANRRNAEAMSSDYDFVFVHDPQPAAIPQFAREVSTRWVWRCHIDTSTPDDAVWQRIADLLSPYDAAIFSIPEFAGPKMPEIPVYSIPPAIDPLIPKNIEMPRDQALALIAGSGVDPLRPFIVQVSRFDPWKDPLGVIAAFERVQKHHSDLQLVLLGNFADDDPEGLVIYRKVLARVSKLSNVHVIVENLDGLVNALQTLGRVVVQKSSREGFGLTVTEALWKGTPVVAGNVGGLRLQLKEGVGGFLVDSVEECADRVDYLLTHEEEGAALGAAGREHVRRNYLMPRLLRDELRVVRDLLNGSQAAVPVSQNGHAGAANSL